MRLRSGLGVAVLWVFTASGAGAELPVPIPVESFFGNSTISEPGLSPDGKNIAFVFSKGDYQRVLVRPVTGGDALGLAEIPMREIRLRGLDWANSGRVLLSGAAPDPKATEVEPLITRLFGVNRERPRLKWLGEKWIGRGPGWVYRQARFADRVISPLPDDRNSVLISHLEFGKKTPSVSTLNVYSGRLRLKLAAIDGVERWHVDARGQVRAAEAFGRSSSGRSYTLLARNIEQRDLMPVFESEDDSKSGIRFAGFHEDPNRLYVLAGHEGRDALYEFDIAARALGVLVFAHAAVDVTAAHYSEARSKVVGAEYVVDEPGIDFFDDEARKEQASIDHSLAAVQSGATINQIVSATRDGNLTILEASSAVQPPVYYAYDRSKKEMNFIFDQRPEISADQLVEPDRIDFEARDGAKIAGYLTFPRDLARTQLPMIVLPHAGEGGRAAKIYDPVVQFFANRGFAVLQVNHRGSSGFGREFLRAGRRDGGRVIQRDINDGVKWAIEQGFADADRIGIFGFSYGGYSALMSLIVAPDLYRAGAGYAAITDLEPILGDGENFPWEREIHSGLIDAAPASRERLREHAPLGRIADIRVPVLLGHGARDPRVRVEHSRKLADALKAAGKQVEYHEYEHEFHGLALEGNRIAFYEHLLEFFETQLAARKPSPDRDATDEEAPESAPSIQAETL